MIPSQAHRRQAGLSQRLGFLLHAAFVLCLVHGPVVSAQSANSRSTMPRVGVHTDLDSLKEIDAMRIFPRVKPELQELGCQVEPVAQEAGARPAFPGAEGFGAQARGGAVLDTRTWKSTSIP